MRVEDEEDRFAFLLFLPGLYFIFRSLTVSCPVSPGGLTQRADVGAEVGLSAAPVDHHSGGLREQLAGKKSGLSAAFISLRASRPKFQIILKLCPLAQITQIPLILELKLLHYSYVHGLESVYW